MKPILTLLKKPRLQLTIIIIIAFSLRLYRLTYPLMDWHSFRQADTASVTREFVRHRYPIWRPHYHDLGNIQSGLDNLEGDRMVEFPLVNYLLAGCLRLFPQLELVAWSRLAAALASTLSVYLLYRLVKQWQGREVVALVAAGTMAVLPFAVYYGRTVLPEPFQVFAIMATLTSFHHYLTKRRWGWWWLTASSFAAALLIKPTSLFIVPVLVVMAGQKDGLKGIFKPVYLSLTVLSLIPLLWWRYYIRRFPAGIPASDWLLNGNGIRLRPAWWRWLFWERLTKMWLGYGGMVFMIAGLLPENFTSNQSRPRLTNFDWLTYAWLSSLFVYLVVFATGNVQHDYYQYLLVPCVSVVVGRGMYKFYELLNDFIHYSSSKFKWTFLPKMAIAIILAISLFVATRENIGKFNVNNWEQVRLGQLADRLLPPDALVIADAGTGDTNFLFQAGRRGWPDGTDLADKIAQGAQFYLATRTDDTYEKLTQNFTLFYQDADGYIIDLRPGQLEVTASGDIID